LRVWELTQRTVEPGSPMIVLNATWQRVALCGLLAVPLALIIACMTPALLVLPFFASGREFILKLLDKITAWARAIVPKIDVK
ncbi:hypothetical protein JYK22_19870, partial [Nonomuraea sp. RK-328]|nr:hypothetical protein [Nonomuraea sp. RK-328]